MTTILAIGDRAYSSWSLRGWLVFDAFGAAGGNGVGAALQRRVAGSPRTVSTRADGAGHALARTAPSCPTASPSRRELASRNPDAGIWPAMPAARGTARALAAEMHAGLRRTPQLLPDEPARGLRALRPARCGPRRRGPARDDRGAGRSIGRRVLGSAATTPPPTRPTPPVAARIAGYGLTVGEVAQAYVARHLAHPSFRRWRAMGPRRRPGPGDLPPRLASPGLAGTDPGPRDPTERRPLDQRGLPLLRQAGDALHGVRGPDLGLLATRSAATRPWPTPRPGPPSWPSWMPREPRPFTLRKPLVG